jgi:glycosyltransferase involved in cell wall biosynthesis
MSQRYDTPGLTLETFDCRVQRPLSAQRYLTGSDAVHTQLLHRALEMGEAARVVVLNEMRTLPPGEDSDDGFSVRFSDRFVTANICRLSLHDSVRSPRSNGNSVYFGKVHHFSQFAQLRSGENTRAPISCVVHSVSFPDLFASYVAFLIQAWPCDRLVATSLAAREAVESLIDQVRDEVCERLGVPPCTVPGPSVELLPLGVDIRDGEERPSKKFARSSLGIPDSAVVALWVGRISESYKADLEPLLIAIREVVGRTSNLRLVVAGTDAEGYSRRVRQMCRDMGIEAQVFIAVDVNDVSRQLLYGAADFFISPADNIQESFGLTLLEAMASELPIIGSRWSGYQDIVEDGVTGFLIDTYVRRHVLEVSGRISACGLTPSAEQYAAAHTVVDVAQLVSRLSILAERPELRQALGRAGYERVQREYSWKIVVKRYGALWRAQVEQTQELGRFGKPGALDFGLAFSKYGMDYCEEKLFVSIAPGLERIVGGMCGLTSSDLDAFRETNGGVQSLASIRRRCSGSSGAVTRALKKGLLRIAARITC